MTILRYALVTLAAVFSAIFIAFCLVAFVISPHDDSPAMGLLGFILSSLLAALLVPLSLGVTAEIVERRAQRRRFCWLGAFVRSLLAIPIMLGPLYGYWEVLSLRPDARDPFWAVKVTLLNCISAVFAVVALRIRRFPCQPVHSSCEQALS